MSLTFTDLFCGAGGASLGLSDAGLELKLAANHWGRAIETHSANFPDAEHLCADVSSYDVRRWPRTDVLWASPECTWHSPAGGRRRPRAQLDLLDDYVPTEGGVRSRATAYDVIRAVEVHAYTAVVVENVVEFAAWPMFDWWLAGLRHVGAGYDVQVVSVSSAHISGETNPPAPQWRDRLYVVCTRRGVPPPKVEPRPLAWCPVCGVEVAAVQSWKRPGRRIGKYRAQYDYRCPNPACRHTRVEPYVLPAAAAIDWSDLGTRIGDRVRPLAAATLARIRAGLAQFAASVVVSVNPDAGEARAYPADAPPLAARTARIGDGLAYPPLLLPAGSTWRAAAAAVDTPMGARTTRETDALVGPAMVVELRRNCTATPTTEPLSTLTARGNHHGLAVAPGAFYVKNYGGNAAPTGMSRPVWHPFGAVTARDHHALVVPYYRTGRAKTTTVPLDTVSTHDRFALVDLGIDVADCRFRMLAPREHLRAQRFPDSYLVHGNKGEQTMQAGNAVSANVAHWLGAAILTALDGHHQPTTTSHTRTAAAAARRAGGQR